MTQSRHIRVAAFLPRSTVNGPGLRSVLWVQGCPMRCPGCFNVPFQPFSGGTLQSVDEIAKQILEQDTEGVTFSGGEPFSQARGLAEVAMQVRDAGRSVVIFSGYTSKELLSSSDGGWRALMQQADMLIAGPHEVDNPSPHPLLSSANQEIRHITERYRDYSFSGGKQMEYRIGVNGEAFVTGLMLE